MTSISKPVVSVNLVDGAVGAARRDETWTLDVAAGTLAYENFSYADAVRSPRQSNVTAAQVQAILDALAEAKWHTNATLCGGTVDGVPYAPLITITSPAGDWTLSVSANPSCAPSNRARQGDVIGCSDYGNVLAALGAVIAGVSTGTCSTYW